MTDLWTKPILSEGSSVSMKKDKRYVWKIHSDLTGMNSPESWSTQAEASMALWLTLGQFRGHQHHHEMVTGTRVVKVRLDKLSDKEFSRYVDKVVKEVD